MDALNDGSRAILKRGHAILMLQLETPPTLELVSAHAEPLPEPSYCPICGWVNAEAGDAALVFCRHWGQTSEAECRYCHGTGHFYLRWLGPMLCEVCAEPEVAA